MIRTCSTSPHTTSPGRPEPKQAWGRIARHGFSPLGVLAALAVVLTLPLAFPKAAQAEDDKKRDDRSAYIEYMVGVSHAPDQTIHGNSASNANLYGRTESDSVGYAIGVAGGIYLMENFRTELQLGFRSTELQGMAVQGESSRIDGRANLSLMTIMANGYFDIDLEALAGIDSPVMPWVGAGVGWGMPRLDASNATDNGILTGQLDIDDTDSVFAYNAMVGLSAPVSKTTTITGGYRYVATSDITLNGRVGATPQRFSYEYDAHEAFVGLRFSF